MGAIVLFVLAASLAAGAIWMFIHADSRAREEAMALRLRAGEGREVAAVKTREDQLHNPVFRAICHFIWRTGSDMPPATVLKILLVLGAMIPVAMMILGVFGGAMVIGFLLAFGYGLLRRQAARRRALIVTQLPGFLEAAMRVLQAGNTFEEAISAAAAESPNPLKPLFQSVGRQVRLGAPIDQVLSETAQIHQMRDLRVIALAATINRKYGGSLRNILRSLIAAIRSRDSAARELRALTAETRFSAVVLAVVPALITTYIYLQNRTYYADMWATTGGRLVLILGVSLQIIGVFVIYRMMGATEDTD